jgi:hypothetical protein
MSLSFHLPEWPASRLVYEAVVAWNFRHLDEEPLDIDSAPWPLIRGAVLAFLRHNLTDYDDRLRRRCEHDPAYRDALASQIAQAALRKYPWLDNDPRPFPEAAEDSLLLDTVAKHMEQLHSLRDQMLSAARDLRRSGGSPQHIAGLQREAAGVAEQIRQAYDFLIAPKISADGTATRSLVIERTNGAYFFHSKGELPLNRIHFVGFTCPRCQASVAQRKGFISLGQGYDRVVVWSCHCLTFCVYQPPRARVAPMTLEHWAQLGGGNLSQATDNRLRTYD